MLVTRMGRFPMRASLRHEPSLVSSQLLVGVGWMQGNVRSSELAVTPAAQSCEKRQPSTKN
jgi:hypothetical protein